MAHKAERGLFELRQGRALYVTSAAPAESALVAAVEGLSQETLEEFRSLGDQLRLVVTHHRGRAMGLVAGNGNGSEPTQLSIVLDRVVTPEGVLRLATDVSATIARGAFPLEVRAASVAESAGLALTRHGGLLPAVLSAPIAAESSALQRRLADGTVLDVPSAVVQRVVRRPGIEVTHVTEAPVPLADAEDSQFVFFREGGGFLEHVAILIGAPDTWPDPVPVRLHSACLTGDLFGSLRCDCGEQLRGSLRYFTTHGGGVLIYLAQEGRGIGLGNKIRAYTLQQEGLDTVDADSTLGFGADERRYDAAIAILQQLGIEQVHLLTNNPEKVRALQESGIEVVERIPLHGRLNRHNLPYVRTKVQRAGHWLRDMISEPLPGD